ncbi:metallophosphoesterase family protein [Cohnella nanjingensis]|uniref:Metallophosphoesterase n=1 Tax=Cohnella nanjingensis TaxID=1387779 RepID=A0A7X0RND6_9BACL|nr:metallophosphoesterase [Cohnella nanjingensis]MBB6670713.1 metallophosphoesterase [Cohnella nanjingensis]
MKLALIGDLHYPYRLFDRAEAEEARDSFYEAALAAFLSIEADYHISLGDLTHEGEAEAFEAVFSFARRRHPGRRLRHVLGNHDTFSLPKSDIRSRTGMPRYEAIEAEEARLLFLDTARDADRGNWGGTLDGEQLDWLSLRLSGDDRKPLLIFAHHPVPGTTARSGEEMLGLDAEPGRALLSLLERRPGPAVYMNGHNHVQSLVRRGRLHFFQAASVLDVPVAWLLTVDADGLLAESVPLLPEHPAERVRAWTAVISRSMDDYLRHPHAEGGGFPAEWRVAWAETDAAAVAEGGAR